MTAAEIIARVASALEGLRVGDVTYAESVLDDLLWEYHRLLREYEREPEPRRGQERES